MSSIFSSCLISLGLEYHSSPTSRSSGFITWQADGEISYSVGAGAVGPDMGDDGSQVDQRLISEEPMVSIAITCYC